MSIEADLRDLQQRRENLMTRRTRAQFELDNAKSKFDDARRVLKDDFNLSSGAEIEARIKELEADRDRLLAEIQADLEAAGV